jgi:hypothetical protein
VRTCSGVLVLFTCIYNRKINTSTHIMGNRRISDDLKRAVHLPFELVGETPSPTSSKSATFQDKLFFGLFDVNALLGMSLGPQLLTADAPMLIAKISTPAGSSPLCSWTRSRSIPVSPCVFGNNPPIELNARDSPCASRGGQFINVE